MDQKPDLLLLPGMLSDGAFWQAQTEALSDICNPLIANYGLEDSIEAMARRVLDRAPESFALAGHSLGGRICLEVYKRARHRVQKLALFCTDFRGHLNDKTRNEEVARRGRLLAIALENGMTELSRGWFRTLIAPERLDDEVLVSALAEMGARHTVEQLSAELHAGIMRPDFSDLISTIDCPTLLCAAGKDKLRNPETNATMASVIAKSRLVVIPESGHMIAMEHPQAITSAMRSWLAA
jgi:pimeloyl-ACP methyl ester carboxylesterase